MIISVVYLREAEVLPELDAWLAKSLDPARLPATIEALAASQDSAIPRELVSLRDEIGNCDQKLAQYRAAPDSGAGPAVGQWITETQARKLAADARMRAATGSTHPAPTRMTKEQIAITVSAIRDLVHALRHAATEDRAEICGPEPAADLPPRRENRDYTGRNRPADAIGDVRPWQLGRLQREPGAQRCASTVALVSARRRSHGAG